MDEPLYTVAVVVVLAVLVTPATVSPLPGAAAAPIPAAGADVAADSTPVGLRDVAVDVTVRRLNETAIAYRFVFEFPDPDRRYRVLAYDGRVAGADGFVAAGADARTLAWTGKPTPSMTVVYDVRGGAAGDCTCVATPEWLLADPVHVQVSVRDGRRWSSAYLTDWFGDATVETSVTVRDGLFLPGVVFFGAYGVTETTTATGEHVRLVVPAAASDAVDEAALLDAMRRASVRFDVGPPQADAVTVVVVPDPGRRAYVDGMAVRGKTVNRGYVFLEASTGPATWLHEYVHTRQTYTAAADMRWFTEATAEYYGNYLAEASAADSLRRVGEEFGDVARSDSVLAAPQSWDSTHVPYREGGQVVAYLDRRVREESGGEATFLDVFRRLNGREGIRVADLQDATAAVVGSRVLDREIDRAVRSGALLDVTGEVGATSAADPGAAADTAPAVGAESAVSATEPADRPRVGDAPPTTRSVHSRIVETASDLHRSRPVGLVAGLAVAVGLVLVVAARRRTR